MWASSSIVTRCHPHHRSPTVSFVLLRTPLLLHHHQRIRSFSQPPPPNPEPFLTDILKRYGSAFLPSNQFPPPATIGKPSEPEALPGKRYVGFSSPTPSSILLLHRALDQSGRLGARPDGLVSRLHELGEMGLANETLLRVLKEFPEVPLTTLDVAGKMEFLAGLGFRKYEIDRILHFFPGFLVFSVGGRLRPLFEEFEDLGFGGEEVRRMVVGNPRLLLGMEVGEASRCVDLLEGLKCRTPVKERVLEKGRLHAAVQVKLRVDCLCKHGLIRREALKVIWVEPRSIFYALEDIEKKIEFLLHEMGFGIDCLVEVPEYLGVNFEKQIVPRYRVLERLRSKGALGFEVGLRQLIKPSRKKFYNMFVKPYPECEALFAGPARCEGGRRQHPSGLWQLFKPSKCPESEEDLANMRAFMKSLV